MNEYRTYTVPGGLVVAVIAATLLGILATSVTLSSLVQGWSDGAIFGAVLAIMVAAFGLMVAALVYLRREIVYSAGERGVREEGRTRGGPRVREVAWGDVRRYRSYTQMYGGLEILRMDTDGGRISVYPTRDPESAATFAAFRDAALARLRAAGVPESQPSAAARHATRTFGWTMLALVLAIPVYALSLPPEERPEIWWLRWLVVAGLASPFIGGALTGGRRRP